MKIHDKFVIELREVIKGYGNDPTVQDPCKFPCDYKFYEIEGVAICEKSFKKMKRLEDEVNVVLDKIRAEIEAEIKGCETAIDMYKENPNIVLCYKTFIQSYTKTLQIIDKYRDKEQEDNGFFDEITDDESDGEAYDKIKEIIEQVKEQEE